MMLLRHSNVVCISDTAELPQLDRAVAGLRKNVISQSKTATRVSLGALPSSSSSSSSVQIFPHRGGRGLDKLATRAADASLCYTDPAETTTASAASSSSSSSEQLSLNGESYLTFSNADVACGSSSVPRSPLAALPSVPAGSAGGRASKRPRHDPLPPLGEGIDTQNIPPRPSRDLPGVNIRAA
jgi:hypothetical protein